MGAEDFSYVIRARARDDGLPRRAAGGDDPETAPQNHSNLVVFDEAAMALGVALYAAAALSDEAQPGTGSGTGQVPGSGDPVLAVRPKQARQPNRPDPPTPHDRTGWARRLGATRRTRTTHEQLVGCRTNGRGAR